MDDETPEMEQLTQEMRAVMAAWVGEPSNRLLKAQYRELQRRYQRLFLEHKTRQGRGCWIPLTRSFLAASPRAGRGLNCVLAIISGFAPQTS
jgi:hypothetical protein